MQTIEIEHEISAEAGPRPIRTLRRDARRVHVGARSSVERLNALASRVEGEIAAILRGEPVAVPH
jgi:hypothetical protein